MRRITFPLVLRKAGSDLLMATTSPQPSGAESGYALYGVPNGEYEIIAVRDFLGDENAFASAIWRRANTGCWRVPSRTPSRTTNRRVRRPGTRPNARSCVEKRKLRTS